MKILIFIMLTMFTLQGSSQEISKQYDKIGKFNKGVALVWKNDHCGLIKQNGDEIAAPEYDKIGPFGFDGIAYTIKDGKTGMLSIDGKVIAENIYESIGHFTGNYAITKMNGLAGMINKKGKVVIENKYESIRVGRQGEIRASKDKQEILLTVKE